MLKIDIYIRKKKVDEAFQAIERYDKLVGGDPILNMYRANALEVAGRAAEAVPYAQKAVDAAPVWTMPLSALMNCQIAANDFDGAVKTIGAIDRLTGFNVPAFQKDPKVSKFRDSPQFKNWLESKK